MKTRPFARLIILATVACSSLNAESPKDQLARAAAIGLWTQHYGPAYYLLASGYSCAANSKPAWTIETPPSPITSRPLTRMCCAIVECTPMKPEAGSKCFVAISVVVTVSAQPAFVNGS
jgi:hypothetical protein